MRMMLVAFLRDDRIFDGAVAALEDEVIDRLLPMNLLEDRRARAQGARGRLGFGLLSFEHAAPLSACAQIEFSRD